MFQFYLDQGFKLFPCNLDKTPKVASWRSSSAHIDAETAERITATGGFVGAWLPKSYVIVDLDRGHDNNVDGVDEFKRMYGDLPVTRTVKTGSGGLHLYFTLPKDTDYSELSQKSIATSIDIRTHKGYVIAAGTNGYAVENSAPVAQIPDELLEIIRKKTSEKAHECSPERALPVKMLKRILKKVPVEDFDTNDTWQEFVTSCIAVSGNHSEVLDVIEKWSKQDPKYAEDETIRKRLYTFEPEGGISAGTFIHIIKREGVSKYLIDQVRVTVGKNYTVPEQYAEINEPPLPVDFTKIHEVKEFTEAMYKAKNQAAMVELFAELTHHHLMYSVPERAFFYFDGNRWISSTGAMFIIVNVLINAAHHYYTDVSKKNDPDADEYLTDFINYVCNVSVLQRLESAAKQHHLLQKQHIPWDSPSLESTLTLSDAVLDFSGDHIEIRKGRPDEYRRLHIELCAEDFKDHPVPEAFKAFLADVFVDEETRKTATYALSTMLSGTGKFRKFQIWNGPGANGKSTLMEVMKYVIGERAVSYKPEILLAKSSSPSLTPELAAFRGALVGFASETEENRRISQGVVKSLTGDETISANPKYKDVIEFETTFQLVLATNFLPRFNAHDSAFIKRVLVLPFNTAFYSTEEEKEAAGKRGVKNYLPSKDKSEFLKGIKAERASILYYLAKRYQEIRSTGVPESEECKKAKGTYVNENNDIEKFLSDFVEFDMQPDNGMTWYFTPTKDIMNLYNEENNTRASARYVADRLREIYPLVEAGTKWINGKLTRGWKHIRLKYGAYPEGYAGNYTDKEITEIQMAEGGF